MSPRLASVLLFLLSLVAACADNPVAGARAIPEDIKASATVGTLAPGFYRGSSTDPTIYIVVNGSRWGIPDVETFAKCAGSHSTGDYFAPGEPYWSLVQTTSAVYTVPVGGTLPSARHHSNLYSGAPFRLGGSSDATVYTLYGCVKAGIPSAAVFQALYGHQDWSTVLFVDGSVFTAFPTSAQVAVAPRFPAGTLIRGTSNEVRWVLHAGAGFGIPSQCAMESHGRNGWHVQQVSDAAFNSYGSAAILNAVPGACEGSALGTADYVSYSPHMAMQYALVWAKRPYGTGTATNRWPDYFTNKCIYFVSQAIMGGLARRSDAWAIYDLRYQLPSEDGWYHYETGSKGLPFINASSFYRYAVSHAPGSGRRGLILSFVTSATRPSAGGADYGPTGTSDIWADGVRPGDVAFFDWTADGNIDHVMMVTRVNGSSAMPGEERVAVTGQSDPVINKSLSAIRSNPYNDQARMHVFVYRPVGLEKRM